MLSCFRAALNGARLASVIASMRPQAHACCRARRRAAAGTEACAAAAAHHIGAMCRAIHCAPADWPLVCICVNARLCGERPCCRAVLCQCSGYKQAWRCSSRELCCELAAAAQQALRWLSPALSQGLCACIWLLIQWRRLAVTGQVTGPSYHSMHTVHNAMPLCKGGCLECRAIRLPCLLIPFHNPMHIAGWPHEQGAAASQLLRSQAPVLAAVGFFCIRTCQLCLVEASHKAP